MVHRVNQKHKLSNRQTRTAKRRKEVNRTQYDIRDKMTGETEINIHRRGR